MSNALGFSPALRPAISSDLNVLSEMVDGLYASGGLHPIPPANIRKSMEYLANKPDDGTIFIIEGPSQQLIGYTIVVNWWSNEFGGRAALLDELYIVPDWRGKGIGSTVIDLIEEYCSSQSMPVLYLEVEDENPRAKKLYSSKGFGVSPRCHMLKHLAESLGE